MSVEQAREELARAEEAERIAREAAAARDKEIAAELKVFEKAGEGRVRGIERDFAAALDGLNHAPGNRANYRIRRIARGYLYGTVPTLELQSPEDVVAQADRHAGALHDVRAAAASAMAYLTDPESDVFLPGNHQLVERLDAIEADAWGAFIARVKHLAGE
jgi:hypothetical protein